MTDTVEFNIPAQQETTMRLVDGESVLIEQEADNSQFGTIVQINGRENVRQFIGALQKLLEKMP